MIGDAPGGTDPSPDLRFASEGEFRSHLCRRIVALLDHEETGNADLEYPPDGIVLERDAYAARRARFLDFLTSNFGAMYQTSCRLEDGCSRSLFNGLLLFRALGYERVRLDSNTDAYWAAKAKAEALASSVSEFADVPGGKNLRLFVLERDGQRRALDCLRANIFFTFLLRQYHLEQGEVVVRPEPGDAVIDAGACFGDTAVAFADDVGPTGRIYAFDPVAAHLRLLNHNIARNGIGNVLVFPTALGDVERTGVLANGPLDPGFSNVRLAREEGDLNGVPVRSIDGLVSEGSLPRIDFIKMDIEGHEMSALRGAEASLRRFRPKLAISLYHRWEDYFVIPAFIDSLDLGYRFYIRNYTVSDGETVLFCVPRAN